MIRLPFLAIAILAQAALSEAAALDLRIGSTRDWVKRTGTSGDSVRYHLEFLQDSTTRYSRTDPAFPYRTLNGVVQSAKVVISEWIVDWKIRITSPDSPMVSDTAILRVHDASQSSEDPDFPSRTLDGTTYWIRPSIHFPIDLRQNPPEDMENILAFPYGQDLYREALATGTTEFSMLFESGLYEINSWNGEICNGQLHKSFCGSAPLVSSRGDSGIVAWMSHGSLWELVAYDGTARQVERNRLNPPIRKGMTWIYRDSLLEKGGNAKPSPPASFVDLVILDHSTDTSGWVRLDLSITHRSDSGRDSSKRVAVQIQPQRLLVRIDSTFIHPWSLNTSDLPFEGIWALGLLEPPIDPRDSTLTFGHLWRWTSGEVDPSFGMDLCQLSRSAESGASKIRTEQYKGSRFGGKSIGDTTLHSWTRVAHAQDSSILSASPRSRATERDLGWLRARLASDPTLEVVRLGLDGSRLVARGNAGLALVERRGVGILQVRDEGRLVLLRLVRP